MARKKCPGCGKPYNGNRCGNCFYESFTEEIAHGGHTHEGEPLVVETPVGNIPRSRTSFSGKRCDTFPGKRRSGRSATAIVVVVLVFLIMMGVMLAYGFMADQMASGMGFLEEVEPEPDITPFENGTVLYDANGVTVTAQWQDGDPCGESIPILVQNTTKQDLAVSTDWVYVNGFFSEYTFVYCEAPAEKTSVGYLWVDGEDLRSAGIETVAELIFRLDIYDTENYEDIDDGPVITFSCAAPDDFVQPVDDSGDLLYQQDGIRVIYKGCTQESCEDGELLFFLENNTDETVQFYVEGAYVNGGEAPIYLWMELIPGTRGIADAALYQLAEEGLESIKDIETLELSLGIAIGENWDSWVQTDLLTVDVNG